MRCPSCHNALSAEARFVPGDVVSSFLRRVGRMPEYRAVTVARQLCAGLAAALAAYGAWAATVGPPLASATVTPRSTGTITNA